MCKAMEDMRNEAAKMKAVHIARLMLDGGKLSYEDIAAYKKQGMISEDEYMQWKYCSIHRANHRGSRKDSFREEKCIIVRQFNTDTA